MGRPRVGWMIIEMEVDARLGRVLFSRISDLETSTAMYSIAEYRVWGRRGLGKREDIEGLERRSISLGRRG